MGEMELLDVESESVGDLWGERGREWVLVCWGRRKWLGLGVGREWRVLLRVRERERERRLVVGVGVGGDLEEERREINKEGSIVG